nr:DUF2256 domain-containing protein [Oscillatoria laete-virens]
MRIFFQRGHKSCVIMALVMAKNLPVKICAHCGRPFEWRKKWERCWDEVRFCSLRCKGGAKRRTKTASAP